MRNDHVPSRWPRRFTLGLIVLAGVLARLAVMVTSLHAPLEDPDNYLPLAKSLVAGDGLSFHSRPTAYRPPLYPLLLVPLMTLPDEVQDRAICGLHLALGAGTIALTMLAARRWGLSFARIALAGGIVALDPVLVAQARAVMTETLATFLMAGSLSMLAGARSVRYHLIAGGLLGLNSLCRPSLLPFAWLVVGGAAVRLPGTRRERAIRAAMIAAGILATLSPWALRNWRLYGEPVWTTTHGGYTLALANNPAYYHDVVNGPPGAVWTGDRQEAWWASLGPRTAGMTEPEADRALRNDALRFIQEHPVDFVWASLARLRRFWGIAPSGRVYPTPLRWATAAWTIPLWIGLILGLRCRSLWLWPRIAAPLALIALTAVHVVYWTDLRMRVPIVPAIALIVANARFGGRYTTSWDIQD